MHWGSFLVGVVLGASPLIVFGVMAVRSFLKGFWLK